LFLSLALNRSFDTLCRAFWQAAVKAAFLRLDWIKKMNFIFINIDNQGFQDIYLPKFCLQQGEFALENSEESKTVKQ